MSQLYSVPGRPLVILAGWLGCQPRSLRRYEAMYKRLGFDVVTRIASPLMVVASTKGLSPVVVPPEWPRRRSREKTLQDLAWDALGEVYDSQCSSFVFHGFSNGGCFLWEYLRNILNTPAVYHNDSDHNDDDTTVKLEELRQRLVGVVFDSSPAFYSPRDRDTFLEALTYCTWWERAEVQAHLLVEKFTSGREAQLLSSQLRSMDYFETMKNDPWDLHQLYLYSKDDNLTPFEPLDGLIRYRQGVFGKDRVLACQWESSPHCCHYLTHPSQYENAVEMFLDASLTKKPTSRL